VAPPGERTHFIDEDETRRLRLEMFSRGIGILVSMLLPFLAMVLPFGHLEKMNALVCGGLALVLSFGALSWDWCRLGAAAVGVWLAASALFFVPTFVEGATTVTSGIALFFFLAGPFSARPRVIRAHVPASDPANHDARTKLSHAA